MVANVATTFDGCGREDDRYDRNGPDDERLPGTDFKLNGRREGEKSSAVAALTMFKSTALSWKLQ